jgi:FMN-dependent NADH-azoreductase
MNILHICADPNPTEESAPKQLAVAFFRTLAEKNPDVNITNVDLYDNPPPFLDYQAIRGFWFPVFIEGHKPTDDEQLAGAYGMEQGELFNAADVVVLTVPMWNFSVPGILKAWMDQVLSPSVAYTMDAQGTRPLHKVRKLILLASSGEVLKQDDDRDAMTPLVTSAFAQAGIRNLSIAWADGQYTFKYTDAESRKEMAIEAAEELAEEVVDELADLG